MAPYLMHSNLSLSLQPSCNTAYCGIDSSRCTMIGEVVRKHHWLPFCREPRFQSIGNSKRLRSRLGTLATPVEENWLAPPDEDLLLLRSTEENEDTVTDLVELFKLADKDGNGKIDMEELRELLQSVDGGLQPVTLDWLSEPEVWSVMQKYDVDGSGDIDYQEFQKLVHDGVLLDGKLEQYQRAFQMVDTTGNGTLGAGEIAQLFKELGQPLSPTKLFKIMEEYDGDGTGQIMFPDFLNMFRGELLDLQDILFLLVDEGLLLWLPRKNLVPSSSPDKERCPSFSARRNSIRCCSASPTAWWSWRPPSPWCRPLQGL
eukprot:jgi/Botrbrau1/16846/Bobra.150_2s0068.1